MKTVMCYGDSITWGQDPVTRTRLPFDKRWPGVLEHALSGQIRVVEEALCDRTTAWDDPFHGGRNGLAMLGFLLESHTPVDLLIIMLGTKDLQTHYNISASTAAIGCGALVELGQKRPAGPGGNPPTCLLVAPPIFGKLGPLQQLCFAGNEVESQKLPECIQKVAETLGCDFFDASAVVTPGETDGIHLDVVGHRGLGLALKLEVEAILFNA